MFVEENALVSNRWRSSVTQSKVRWGPSVHRSLSGKRSDHALVECTWKWRMRHVKPEPSPDFSVMQDGITDKKGNSGPNKQAQAFQATVTAKLKTLVFSSTDSTTDIYSKLCKVIKCVAEDLPKKKKKSGTKRKVSKKTRDLHDRKERAQERTTKERAKLKEERKNQGLPISSNGSKNVKTA